MTDGNPQPKPRPSDDLTAKQLIETHGNKSAAIRALHKQGYTVTEIAKRVGVIYQHARNVIQRPLKRVNHNPPPTGDS
jgi:transposase